MNRRIEANESGRIMDGESICVLGNGACPTECPLFEKGKELYEMIPYGADLRQVRAKLRIQALFADAFNHDLDVRDVARLMDACVRELSPDQRDILPATV